MRTILTALLVFTALAFAVPQPAGAQVDYQYRSRRHSLRVRTPYYRGSQYYGRYGYRNYGYRGYGGYGRGYYSPIASGLRFNLDLIPKKDREEVRRGRVVIDGFDYGRVDRHDQWFNSGLALAPGPHRVEVELPDGRKFETQVLVEIGVRSVDLAFDQPAEGSTP